jgi:hypothetical protein
LEKRSIEIMGKLTDLIFGGRVFWGPSLDVIARKIGKSHGGRLHFTKKF